MVRLKRDSVGAKDEDNFVKRWNAAGNTVMEKCDDRDFQGTGGGACGIAQAESGRRPAGDLTVHGGEYKRFTAIRWSITAIGRKNCRARAAMGMFGENFTVHGLLEEEVHLGDRYSLGSAEVVVTQPRLPCYKLECDLHRTIW